MSDGNAFSRQSNPWLRQGDPKDSVGNLFQDVLSGLAYGLSANRQTGIAPAPVQQTPRTTTFRNVSPVQRTPQPQGVSSWGNFAARRDAQTDYSTDVSGAIEGALSQLENQRNLMISQRNAAIGAAGRGAGAPYAAQIARIDQAILDIQRQQAATGRLSANKIATANTAWDFSIGELGKSYDEAIDKTRTINAEGATAISRVYSSGQSHLLGTLENVPGMDEASKSAAVDIMGEMQEQIMNMDKVTGEGALAMMQAAENLAVALGKQSKARTQLEFVRQQTIIESSLKEQLNNALQDKQAAQRAQGAAVRAAREAAAAAWRIPDSLPPDQTSFAMFAGMEYLRNNARGLRDTEVAKLQTTAGLLYQNGMEPTLLGRLLGGAPMYSETQKLPDGTAKPLNYAAQWELSTGGDWYKLFGEYTPSTLATARRILPYALQGMYSGADYYTERYRNTDPNAYSPGSLDYVIATGAQGASLGLSEDEIRYAQQQAAEGRGTISGYSAPRTTTSTTRTTSTARTTSSPQTSRTSTAVTNARQSKASGAY